MPRLLIATNNNGKVIEMKDLLRGLGWDLVTPRDIGLDLEVTEDGLTYAENATKKANLFCAASGLPALADDSGLEVEALHGQPGLYSHRFGPQPATDTTRRHYLLAQLAPEPKPWLARFVATIAIALPGKQTVCFTGECPGEIISVECGSGGFGYDPIFFLPATGLTMAELNMETKNTLSHRAQAIKNAIPYLQSLLAAPLQTPGT